MAIGWISIHRELRDCWVANDKPYNYMAAWVDLLLMASHKDTKLLFDGNLIDVKRGSFITSILKLSDRWGWSRTKTKKFLDMLVSDNMIEYKSDNKKTAINIVNYSKFQDVDEEKKQQKDNKKASEEHQKNIRKTSEEHQKDTINNDKQCNNNDKQYIYSEIPELEKAIIDYINMRKKIKKPITNDSTLDRKLKQLEKLSSGNVEMKIAILNQSTDHCWQDLYELKTFNGYSDCNNHNDNSNQQSKGGRQ